MPENSQTKPGHPPLGRNQKLAVAFLAVVAFVFLALWTLQFKKTLTGPFNPEDNDPLDTYEPEEDAKALAKDTDKDGLLDSDELNIHRTSPYLEDSDSDGLLDGQEIKNGTDPNCPEGRTCADAQNLQADNNVPTSSAGSTDGQPSAGSSGAETLIDLLSGGSNAAILRKALSEAGMSAEILDQISDEDLLKSYQETLKSQGQ